MTVRVVGAGLGRTGTHSLKVALEQLLGEPCYHMLEVFAHPDQVAVWQRAVEGDPPDWTTFFADYGATVDWPAAAFWSELSDAFPDAVVVLSLRDADAWWRSAQQTIFEVTQRDLPDDPVLAAQLHMIQTLLERRFTADWGDEATAKAAYERHNRAVRALVDPERLVEWRAEDGWAPICEALRIPVPEEPFPHLNSAGEFRIMAGLESPPEPA